MRCFLLTTLLAAVAAQAAVANPRYAAISLIGDKLDIVTYQPAVGSELDTDTHMPLALPQDELDGAALRAIDRALRDTLPGTSVTLLAASAPDSFANQDRFFNGGQATPPPEVDAALRREGAAMALIVSKHHGEARLQARNEKVGNGRLEGLGFYLDTRKRVRNRDTGQRSIGFIAPFVYVDVSLVDIATGKVVRQKTIESSQVIGTASNEEATTPWEALTGAQKVAILTRLLTRQLRLVVPLLLTGQAAPSDATAGTGAPQ